MKTNKNARIYFKREDEYLRQEAILNASAVSETNKRLIKDYVTSLNDNMHKGTTLSKIYSRLRLFCLMLNKDLDKLTADDMKQAITKLNANKRQRDGTKATHIKVLKQFFRAYKKKDPRLQVDISELPILLLRATTNGNKKNALKMLEPKIAELQEKAKQQREATEFYQYMLDEVRGSYVLDEIQPSEIINEQDVIQLIEHGCRSIKEKAYIAVLHETGARIGEFLGVRIKDIVLKENLAEMTLSGKTGTRLVYLHSSLPYLMVYLDNHLDKHNPDSYLWLCEDFMRKGQPMMHVGSKRLLARVFKRAGLNKRHNAHWFRHSRASLLAPKISETILKKFMGWTRDSAMMGHYCHISNNAVEDAIMQMRGLESKQQEAQPIKCGICGTLNAPMNNYCYKCHRPLRLEQAMHDQEAINTEIEKRINDMMTKLTADPSLKDKFEAFKRSQAAENK
jgi:site-specific recombinase XerD